MKNNNPILIGAIGVLVAVLALNLLGPGAMTGKVIGAGTDSNQLISAMAPTFSQATLSIVKQAARPGRAAVIAEYKVPVIRFCTPNVVIPAAESSPVGSTSIYCFMYILKAAKANATNGFNNYAGMTGYVNTSSMFSFYP